MQSYALQMGCSSGRGMLCMPLGSLSIHAAYLVGRLAYRAGVTSAVVAPTTPGIFAGLSGVFGGLGVSFSLGAAHKLERGAVLQEVTGVHMRVMQALPGPSVSTQIALLRRLLLRPVDGPSKEWFLKVTNASFENPFSLCS